jgi:hypothetical protein
VISNTAQWAKEKQDKIENQWSALQHNGCIADHCLSILSFFFLCPLCCIADHFLSFLGCSGVRVTQYYAFCLVFCDPLFVVGNKGSQNTTQKA